MHQDRLQLGNFGSNALEALVLADRENVHSAMLAWLLRSPEFPLEARWGLLCTLAQLPTSEPAEIHTRTEWGDLDILVEIGGRDQAGLVAIENKLKARESDDQLGRYDQSLDKEGRRILAKIFLTYVGDPPRQSSDWLPSSYELLLEGLELLCVRSSNQYAKDYRDLVRRLVTCRRLVLDSRPHTASIFDESAETVQDVEQEFSDYVFASKLRATLQRVWLLELAKHVTSASSGWSSSVEETNGAALVNFFKAVTRNQSRVHYGLQLQRGKLKAYAQPAAYSKDATEAELVAVKCGLTEISKALDLPRDRKATVDRGRGFRSYSVGTKVGHAEGFDVNASANRIISILQPISRLAPN